MRLFCLIPNYVFEEKISDNEFKIGSIDCDDLAGTYHENFTFDLPAILEYLDKEDWVEDSIACFTTPAEAKEYLDQDSVMISFEKADGEFIKIDANTYFDYLKTKINFENAFNKALEKGDEERCEKLNSAFENFEEKMLSQITSPKSFYDSLVIVPSVEISSIKALYVLGTNPILFGANKKGLNLIIEKDKNRHVNKSVENKITSQGK